MTTAQDQLAAWQEVGLVEVPLPSGFRVRVRPATAARLMAADLLGYELLGIVAVEHGGELAKAPPEVQGRAYDKFETNAHVVAATAVRDIWTGAAWERITIAPEAFLDGTYDRDDVDAITQVALSRLTSAEESEGVATSDLATFRDDGSGVVDRPDGGEVRPEPVKGLPRAARPVARGAGRRGDRVSPVPG